jgi:hypothetical protein
MLVRRHLALRIDKVEKGALPENRGNGEVAATDDNSDNDEFDLENDVKNVCVLDVCDNSRNWR